MEKMIKKSANNRKTLVNGAIAVFVIALFVLGCGGSSTPAPAEYVGSWTGADGSTLTIRADGSGDLKSGSSTVTNGSVEIKDGKLSVTLVGIGKTWNIDEPPKSGKMKLDGVVYSQSGSTQTDKTDKTDKKETEKPKSTTKADASKKEVPSETEAQEMAKATLLEFNKAIEQEDFTDFHDTISKTWQKEITPQKFNEAFAEFIEKKVDISDISSEDAEFSPSPAVNKEQGFDMLTLNGEYATSPKTKFELKYIPEGKEWKLSRIRVVLVP